MDHIQLRCDSLHALDVVNLTSEMITYYSDASGIAKYINMLNDAQKKSQWVQLPIPNIILVTITSK